jgi:D-alanyl-D-alanine carboxypeptidase/D-alanyl-D-alanine-endopeptidase (penicillin-binding protein 4)
MRLFRVCFLIGILLFTTHSAFAKHKVVHKKKPQRKTAIIRSIGIAPVIYGAPQLATEINRVITNSNSNADIAVYVKSMRYGDALYSRNINQPLTPASTMKILTAGAALIFLGPEYRFSTQLLTDAKSVKNGILQGNLYIVLSGDPTLTYPDLAALMMSLRNQQIIGVAGNVYIDNTAYDQSFYGPGWLGKDKSYCYGAPISASIINRNCLSFQVAPSKPGKLAQVKTPTKYFFPQIRNSVTTSTRRSRNCSFRMSTGTDSTISIDGCMGRGNYASGVSYVVTDVPEYNRALFKSVLSQLGVMVYGTVTFGSATSDLSVVGTHQSGTLREMIKTMLKKSDNVIAGALFKKIGQLYSRQPGSWANGSLAVSQILSKRAGVNISGMRVLDGSGLSGNNLTTSAQLMQVLDYIFHNNKISTDFITALPIAGVDGTLKHRMWNIARRVRAKTGTISGVISLAGYVESGEKEPLAFVIMINGGKGFGWRYKSIEDKIATALTRYKRET